jgi:hypothetical protein
LKATVKATPVDADGQGNTNELIGLALRIQNNPGWMSADVLHGKLVELQNRCSASLAMSTDGSFPVAPPPIAKFLGKVTIARDEKQSTNRHPE